MNVSDDVDESDERDDSVQLARAGLNQETAKIPWSELQRFFAGGVAIGVAPELDLLEVAYQMSRDNTPCINLWMADGQLAAVSDEQALQWLQADTVVWSVVVRPWVLVQAV
jgi:hypothetical protein